MIERSDGVRLDDHVDGGGRIKTDAVEGDRDTAVPRSGRLFVGDGLHRD
ncbi:MAG: hypothetical protein P1V20_24960 [Verrucomicrobiales bacterium]|nr:hypothetical protein [Verrucomicrobiales bacterium]